MCGKHSRRRFIKSGAIVSTAILAGCSGGDDGTETSGGASTETETSGGASTETETSGGAGNSSTPRLALSIPTLEFTFYVRMQNAWGTAKQNGRISEESAFYDAQGDQATQISNVETAITNEVDLLLISPVTADGITPALEAAEEAGIPVIASDRDFANKGFRETYIGSNNTSLGKRSTEMLLRFMSDKSGQDAYNVIQLEGTPGAPNVRLRGNGFESVIQANDNLNTLDSQTGEFTTQGALDAMSDLITRHGDDIDGVFCQNDLMCLGAQQALSNNNISVPITGVDGTEGWVEQFSDNQYFGTLAQLPEGMVDQSITSAKAVLANEDVQNRYIVEGRAVTQENASDYLSEYFG